MKTLETLGREELKELLLQLPEASVNLFNRMYGSVEKIPLEKMGWAIKQCERTIAKNNTPTKRWDDEAIDSGTIRS